MNGTGTADDLRRRFDALFAAPPATRGMEALGLLGLRIANDAYALRIRDMQGLAAARTIIPVPGASAAMLGLAGLRGLVVPVFSLAALMGYGDQGPPRWLVLCGGEGFETVALGFAEFDGYLEAPGSALRPIDQHESRGAHVHELVEGPGEARGIVDLASVVKAIYAAVPRLAVRGAVRPMEER